MYCIIMTYSTSYCHLTYGSMECNKDVCMYVCGRLGFDSQSGDYLIDMSIMALEAVIFCNLDFFFPPL
jgi:hypothetical protein